MRENDMVVKSVFVYHLSDGWRIKPIPANESKNHASMSWYLGLGLRKTSLPNIFILYALLPYFISS